MVKTESRRDDPQTLVQSVEIGLLDLGVGLRVQGSGFINRPWDFVWGLGFVVQGFVFRVSAFGFKR